MSVNRKNEFGSGMLMFSQSEGFELLSACQSFYVFS